MKLVKSKKLASVVISAIIIAGAGVAVLGDQEEPQMKDNKSINVEEKVEPVIQPDNKPVEKEVEVVEPVEEVQDYVNKDIEAVENTAEEKESPISSDEEFFKHFFMKVREQHKETHLMSNSSAYNSIYRLYKSNPSIFLPSKTDSIINTCLSQIKEEPDKFIYECTL